MNETIKFKKTTQDNHIGYYMTIFNQTNFFNESIYSSYPCYFDCQEVYKIGVRDTFHLDDNSLMYSLIVEYFSLDKMVHIIAPNLKDIDKSIEPTEIFWSHDIDFDYRTGEPKEEISKFRLAYKYSFAEIDIESICRFSHAFSSAIVSYTFIIGAEEKSVKELLQNQDQIPIADEFLDICDYMVTIKIIEDDEGYNNHVHIQSKKRIDKRVERLEYIMEVFRDKYDELIVSIGKGDDMERNTELYLAGVKNLRAEIFDVEHKERKETQKKVLESCLDEERLMAIDWSRLSTTAGLNSASNVPDLLRTFSIAPYTVSDELYNTITRQGDVYTASYYAIPILIDIIQNSNLSSVAEAYDTLFEIVIGFSAYNEEVIYKNELIPLKEANYRLVHEYIDLYFEDLEAETDEKTASLILDLISLFLEEKEKKDIYLNRLNSLASKSVISKEIKEMVFDYTHSKKVAVLDKILNAKRNKDNSKITKEEYLQIIGDGLDYLSDNTGCIDDLKVTENILDRLYHFELIDSEMYRKCIENSASGQWV